MEFLDKESWQALEIQAILNEIDILSPYGRIYKEKMRPYLPGEEEALKEELNKVEVYMAYARDRDFLRKIDSILGHLKDLSQSIRKAGKEGVLTEVELFELKQFLIYIRQMDQLLEEYKIRLWEDMEISPLAQLEELLDPEATGIATFYIYDTYSENLKKIRQDKRDIEGAIKRKKKDLARKVEEELGLKLRPDNTLIVSKAQEGTIREIEDHPSLAYLSETYMNIKYCLKTTDEISLLERQVLILKEEEEKEEFKIRQDLSREIGNYSRELFKNIASIGKIDLILAKAKLGLALDGRKAQIVEEDRIEIFQGRHPIVERNLKARGLNFTPINIGLKPGISCITGANMGGKTISLKLVGLLTTMAQYGLMVPVQNMTLGLRQFIKSSVGDLQSTDQGLSTFGGEIKLLAQAMERAEGKGLILIDELARGTNPEEGYAISKAIVEYLKDKKSISLITTHYDNIGNTEGVAHFQVQGLSQVDFHQLDLEIREAQGDRMSIINKYMDYRLRLIDQESQDVPRDALNIARIMGLKEEIINMAEKNLKGR